jgi:hypothetical protein
MLLLKKVSMSALVLELFYRMVWTHYSLEVVLKNDVENVELNDKNEIVNDNDNDDDDDDDDDDNDDNGNDNDCDDSNDDDDDDDEDDDDDSDEEEDDDDDDDDGVIIDDLSDAGSISTASDSLPDSPGAVMAKALAHNVNGMALLARLDRRRRRRNNNNNNDDDNNNDNDNDNNDLPPTVSLFFDQAVISGAMDECEARTFAAARIDLDCVGLWSLPFDVTPALDALSSLVYERQSSLEQQQQPLQQQQDLSTLRLQIYQRFENDFASFLQNIGISLIVKQDDNNSNSNNNNNNNTPSIFMQWNTTHIDIARQLYTTQFRNLTCDGTVSSSSNFCALFPDLLLLADSRTDTSLAKVPDVIFTHAHIFFYDVLVQATASLQQSLANAGQLNDNVGELIALLDELMCEQRNLDAMLNKNVDAMVIFFKKKAISMIMLTPS